MAAGMHPLAPHALPPFITPPGETDALLVGLGVVLVAAVLGAAVLYLTLHALPERLAHGRGRGQIELVAVLALLALFTHQNIFWVAALVLALVELPDLQTPARRIAEALERMTGRRRGGPAAKDGPATQGEDAP
ncbi:hypothetical protein [Rubrimonas cliftonensis]|uniref:Uncharacterized protein n=1 Tax=Rubrimonas cliftonensis TaxID=89524 RepID=A0A1H3YT15_9RHOB|nr:hypothetical protein [Rubrimonas cliftonensis]SEA14550.1 hypothetical protein SAMN05444370_103233 [Rubrimonas cliftonensis]